MWWNNWRPGTHESTSARGKKSAASAQIRPGRKGRRLQAWHSVGLVGVLIFATLPVPPATGNAAPGPAAFITARFATAAPNGFAGMCTRYSWMCEVSRGRPLPSAADLVLAKRVNLYVNLTTPQITDSAQYGVGDYWALPTARGGDCEDIAMLKKERLVQAGLPAQDLMIASVLDKSRDNHAVLVVRTEIGDFVLDNLTNSVLPWERTGYTFLTMQNPQAPRHWEAVLRGGMIGMRVASN